MTNVKFIHILQGQGRTIVHTLLYLIWHPSQVKTFLFKLQSQNCKDFFYKNTTLPFVCVIMKYNFLILLVASLEKTRRAKDSLSPANVCQSVISYSVGFIRSFFEVLSTRLNMEGSNWAKNPALTRRIAIIKKVNRVASEKKWSFILVSFTSCKPIQDFLQGCHWNNPEYIVFVNV